VAELLALRYKKIMNMFRSAVLRILFAAILAANAQDNKPPL